MTFSWKEFLDLARFLNDYDCNKNIFGKQALQRTSVSRAYYASFCHASEATNLNKSNRSEDHSALIQHLKSMNLTKMASYIKDMRIWRNACDYEIELKYDLDMMVRVSINRAEEVFDKINNSKTKK